MGVPRALFGNLGDGTFGFRCSRPGVNVKTTSRGDLLYDTSGIVFQKILSGETTLITNSPPTTVNVNGPSLPSAFASYSNLHMWANVYSLLIWDIPTSFNVNSYADETNNPRTNLRYGVESGVVKFTCSTTANTTDVVPVDGSNRGRVYIRSSWAVFNALMS